MFAFQDIVFSDEVYSVFFHSVSRHFCFRYVLSLHGSYFCLTCYCNISKKKWLSTCAKLNNRYAMKMYGRVDVYVYIFLTLALVGDELSASCPGHCTPMEGASGTHLIRGWVGPVSLEYVE
jgi:hypothetical protein